jgi:hypothetical protein
MSEHGPIRAVRGVFSLTFRGSRQDLERVTALRLEAAVLLIFLAARFVHLGQAGIDLGLAGRSYTRHGLAWTLGGACLLESLLFAGVTLRAGRLTRPALFADALFGLAGLVVMSVATTKTLTGSLNWMLPYTVATATGLGLVVMGAVTGDLDTLSDGPPSDAKATLNRPARLVGRRPVGLARSAWPCLALVVALAAVYVWSAYREHSDQIWGYGGNYFAFFVAAAAVVVVLRRRLAVIGARNAAVTGAAAELAHEAQWRAVAVDVFGPVLHLLDRLVGLDDGLVPSGLREEANRLILMIEAVRPGEARLGSESIPVDVRGTGSL